MNLFEPKIYIARRKALMEKMGKGILFFPGAAEQPINYKANTFPFRQDSHFLYYFGWSQPGLCGIVDADKGVSILVGDDLSLEGVVWMGPQPTMKARIEKTGVEESMPTSKLKARITGKEVHYLPPYHGDRILYLAQLLDRTPDEIRSGFSQRLVETVIQQRIYKQPEEIVQMEEALTITAAIHDQLRKKIAPGKSESHLRGIAEGIAFAQEGRLAYQAICTVQGQTLHNNEYHRRLKEGDMLLCDIGAENKMGYAGDITRTYPVSRQFTTQQAEIYDLVLRAETESIKAVKPGVKYKEVHLGAARIITEGLKSIGLMQGDVEEAVAAGAHALFFPHGLGHMIGLDVHDLEGLGEDHVGYDQDTQRSDQFGTAYLRLGRDLEPGFTLTVEPGVYFIPELINQWKKEGRHADFIVYDRVEDYKKFTGIRIEDNVLVTKEGCRILGPSIPKVRSEVERE